MVIVKDIVFVTTAQLMGRTFIYAQVEGLCKSRETPLPTRFLFPTFEYPHENSI